MPIANLLLINFSSAALSAQFELFKVPICYCSCGYLFESSRVQFVHVVNQRCMHYCSFSWAQASLFNVID